MNSYTGREYQLDTEYRQRNFNSLHLTSNQATRTFNIRIPHTSKKVILTLVMIMIGLLFSGFSTQAQVRQEADASISADIEYALIMGAYYYDHGRYEDAIEQFQIAIEEIPEQLFVIAPEQSIVFWQLGEALEANGQLVDAVYNYEYFLNLAGEGATDYAIAYVSDLRTSLKTINA